MAQYRKTERVCKVSVLSYNAVGLLFDIIGAVILTRALAFRSGAHSAMKIADRFVRYAPAKTIGRDASRLAAPPHLHLAEAAGCT